jgi:hypothetical protein
MKTLRFDVRGWWVRHEWSPGLLLPATADPEKDREIFLKLMTMDNDGLWRRKTKAIPGKRLLKEILTLPHSVQNRFLDSTAQPVEPQVRRFSRTETAKPPNCWPER